MDRQQGLPIDDIVVDGMLHCVALRSRIRRGTITMVVPQALPDNVLFISANDIPGANSIKLGDVEVPVLADSRIHHLGQAIALLCGPDEFELQSLLDQVDVQYETEDPQELTLVYEDEQVVYSREIAIGNPSSAFEKAFQVIEGEYRIDSGRVKTVHSMGAFASVDDDRVSVLAPTGWLYHLQSATARSLGISIDLVRAEATPLTCTARGNIWLPSLVAAQSAIAATVTGRPVRMILSPRERQQLSARRPGCLVHHKTALTRKGTVSAMEITLVAEEGSFPTFPVEHLDRMCFAAVGHYSFRSLRVVGRMITTSLPPIDTFGGLGFSEAFFALEVHVTRLAELCQEDPLSWRLKNLLRERSSTISKARAGSTPQRRLLDASVRASDFTRKYAANELLKNRRGDLSPDTGFLRGIGVATAFVGGGFMSADGPDIASVSVGLDSNGLLKINSSCSIAPDEAHHRFAGAASRVLGLDSGPITIEAPSTDTVPDSGPAVFSRDVTVIQKLVVSSAQAIQKRRFRAPLPMDVTRSKRSRSGKRWESESFQGTPFSPLSWGCCVAEVELDTVSLEIRLRGIWLSLSIGNVIDRDRIKAAIEAELAETYELCRGHEAQWWSSGMKLEGRVPRVSLEFVQGSGFKAGAIDGLASSTFAPAFVSAVSQATGFYFDCMPLTRALIMQYAEA
jgi:CO/xanthine dehydrogenase Mo-binding subunit